MKRLLENEFLSHYGLKRTNVEVRQEQTSSTAFDLVDDKTSMIVPYGEGTGSFQNESGEDICVIDYENFITQLAGTRVEQGMRRCDFLVHSLNADTTFLLNEHTTAKGDKANLEKPISDKKGAVTFPGGKYEKAATQLAESVEALMEVEQIKSRIDKFQHRICLMSYRTDIDSRAVAFETRKAFGSRYRQVEAKATGERGALIPDARMERYGFEYRRISHDYSFALSPKSV